MVEGARGPRIDGRAKVTGSKVYARDARPGDPGDLATWPKRLHHVLLLRAGRADAVYAGIDESLFPVACSPAKIIRAADLRAAGIKPNDKFGSYWLVEEGSVPQHRGQPVAFLYYEEVERLRDVLAWLHKQNTPVRFGLAAPTVETDIRRLAEPLIGMVAREQAAPPYGSQFYVRVAGDGLDQFSFDHDGGHSPLRVADGVKLPSDETLERNRAARASWDEIERLIALRGWSVLERTFSTPTVDPMFMEPEAGLAWYDQPKSTLRLVVGTQSPTKDRLNVAGLFDPHGKPSVGTIALDARPPGGGFGGRDESSIAMYAGLAAVFSDRSVRIAFDRFEQFQCGIKRHASVVHNKLAYDADGNLQALISLTLMDGGGEANLTMPVVGLAAMHAGGPYRIPRTVLGGYGIRTPGATAGSMRGFGIPQVAFAIESMIDEVATRLHTDPIAYRLERVAGVGDRDIAGSPLDHHLVNRKVCELALAQELWQRRDERKRTVDRPGELVYGVGFAMCMEAYGTTSDAALAEVRIARDGRITVASSAVDMGQGAATALAIATLPFCGRPADEAELGQSAIFDHLGLKVDPAAKPPNGTPKIVNAMSASMTAFHKLQAVEEACRVLWDHGLSVAAERITGTSLTVPSWSDSGDLIVDGHAVPWAQLCGALYDQALPTSAMVHTYFQHRFAAADYTVGNRTVRRYVDALGIRFGEQPDVECIARANQVYPSTDEAKTRRTLYASAGHLIAVEVHVRSGTVRVTDAITILDAGRVHHEQLLAGQAEGGLAMGLGMALLEELPPSPSGNDGTWNLHRYSVARATHMPLASMRLVLVPFGDSERILADGQGPLMQKKGIAEATMTTVPPAVANAIAHATGARLNRLPFSRARVLEALSSP